MSAPAVPPGGFEVRGAELMAGGRSVTELAGQLGTPLYIYDRRQIAARVRELRAAMPAGLGLHYAIKANPMPEVVAHLAALVDGLDTLDIHVGDHKVVRCEAEFGPHLAALVLPEDRHANQLRGVLVEVVECRPGHCATHA